MNAAFKNYVPSLCKQYKYVQQRNPVRRIVLSILLLLAAGLGHCGVHLKHQIQQHLLHGLFLLIKLLAAADWCC